MDDKFVGLVIKRLSKRYGANLRTQLVHRNLNQLFVAVLLSPQSNDKQTNWVTGKLFKKYKSWDDYADADLRGLMQDMNGMNFYKTKARNLQKCARLILKNFGGKVPKTMSELLTLPGVGRKVANVVLLEGYGINEGIPIDTHNIVVARRLHLTRQKDPYKIERDLMKKVPPKYYDQVSNLFIELGRDTCKMQRKECCRCVLKDICPSSNAR